MTAATKTGGLHLYRAVLRLPGARPVLVAGLIGQLPIGMVPIALLLPIEHNTGSYATAGIVVATYSATSGLLAPLWGRLSRRTGVRKVLVATGCAHALAVCMLVFSLAERAPLSMVIGTVALVGATRPIVSGAIQSLWAELATEQAVRRSAYMLQTLELESVWILGPIAVGGSLAALGPISGPLFALAASGFFGATGAFLVAMAWRPAPPQQSDIISCASPQPNLYNRSFVVVLLSVALFEIAAGAGIVTITASAQRASAPTASGILIALWALGSVVSGVWFNSRKHNTRVTAQYRRCLLALAASYGLFAAPTEMWQLALALLIGGAALAPTFTAQYSVIADLTPPHARTEGFTWIDALAAAGGALGAALSGVAIQQTDWTATGFLIACFSTLAAAAIATPAVGGRTLH